MFGREVPLPARMRFEPVVDLVGIVREEVVHYDVAVAFWVAGIDHVEQVHEGGTIVVLRAETEQLAAPYVESSHQRERTVADVLEFATHRLTGPHGNVGVTPLERLHSGLLVDADDVLPGWRLVVDA